MLDAVRDIRIEDSGIGCYKLWIMLTVLFGAEFMPGRDSFYALLRQHRLMLPARKTRHTTNSNHRYHKWKNLIKGLTLTSANQLWVSDITYIPLANGEVCYLHLITDAYSHKIVGWVLADTLRVSATINALQQAIEQAVEMTGDEKSYGPDTSLGPWRTILLRPIRGTSSETWHCHQYDGRLQTHRQCRCGTYQRDY